MKNYAYIVDVLRTPRGKGKKTGALQEVKPIDLLRTVLFALEARHKFPTELVDDILVGCVTPLGEQGGNLGKALALYAGWHEGIAGLQLNRFCASGLETINTAAAKISAGYDNLIIAGGVESMSRIPMGSDGGTLLYDPAVSSQVKYIPQGVSADLIATLEKYSRQQLDEYALRAHERAHYAQQNGYFDSSLVPISDQNGLPVLRKDETIRPTTNLELLADLPPSFAQIGKKGYDTMALGRYPILEKIEHLHTAGNSSQRADGAALALLANEATCQQLGLKPRARIITAAASSSEPTIMLTGTIPAVEKALQRANLRLEDIDLWEVNEAFAASVLKMQNHFNIDSDKLNVNGGAIALGHPLGATGTMLMAALIDELERRQLRRGLVALCTGGGMGVATIVELC
jgi:acetyl-CoA C-acetyltransferase